MLCMQQTKTHVDIPALLPSWQRSLRAARRSPRTVQSYTEAAEQLADFLVRRGMPTAVESIRREHVESFIEDLDTRFKPTTVGVRFRSVQQLFKWLLEEGEITSNPMERMRSPTVPEDPPAVLSDVELRALLKACESSDFAARRDMAVLRTFIDTGARLSEIANLRMENVDLDDQTLTVVGKGSRVRVLPIGAKTVKAIRPLPPRQAIGPGRVVDRREGTDDTVGHRADDPPPCHRCGDRSRPPAPVSSHVCASLACHRGPGRRSPGDRGLALERDAAALRGELSS